jgi:ectoine hydroxylase-related dioxygenase (phytanoyl-CoA dioxygenase family)
MRDRYFEDGAARARSLANRGPVRFDAQGRLARDIVDAYEETGFYVFEGAIDEQELAELDADLAEALDRAPADEGLKVDRHGRKALGASGQPLFLFARPLSDPWGGTKLLNGRHPVRMEEPEAARGAPERSIFLMLGLFADLPATLRLSAHPDMLRVAEAINGPDFVPYNDSIFLKEPGLGASIAWHQDGTTHWENPTWDPGIHGFNFMAQLCRTTPENGLWVVPGSHRHGHADIEAMVQANGGATRLPDAVPMLCERGDIAICNRQCVHGSFANDSPDRRVTFVWGFFRHDAVLDAEVDMPATRPGEPPSRIRYTEPMIRERCRIVQLAIDERHEHRPTEAPYRYAVCADEQARGATGEDLLDGYRARTIFI